MPTQQKTEAERMVAAKKREFAKYCQNHPDDAIEALLETEFWPQGLVTDQTYQRFEDDSRHGWISISFSGAGCARGDAFYDVSAFSQDDPEDPTGVRRFRTEFGGGESLRVRRALIVLALAIKRDNEEYPQNRPPRSEPTE